MEVDVLAIAAPDAGRILDRVKAVNDPGGA
jgi:hypothetical protein